MLTEILCYADLHGITAMDDRMEFVRFMRALDGAYLKHMAQKDSIQNV